MGSYNGGIDHHVFVVGVFGQMLENPLKNPALRPSAEALVDRFPITKTLGQITPGAAGPKSVKNGFDEESIIFRCTADVSFTTGQKILDPIPLVIAQSIASHRSALLKPTTHESANG
jgi:hypothetical protein